MVLDYLARGEAPFPEELWAQIDANVTNAAADTLVARRFLPLYGPLGPGADCIRIDAPGRAESFEDGFAVMGGRTLSQLPQLYEDFWLFWRDLESVRRTGAPIDLGAARTAAQALALREDAMVFYGLPKLSVDGLLTAKGINTQKRSDWTQGEGAFTDVASGVATLLAKGRVGRHTLLVSPDLFVQLQRIQPGTGVLESERLGKLLDGRLFTSPTLKAGTAALICAQAQYVDIAVGQDIAVAYAEHDPELNHHLRVLETALPRIKAPDAVVLFK